jgi:hypothetical protein
VLRLETTGGGGLILSGNIRPSLAPPAVPAADDLGPAD